MNYPGGKNGSGIYQKLINLMPPHRVYIEAFLGSGAIMRLKRPAIVSIGIDSDDHVLSLFPGEQIPNLTLLETDAVKWLASHTVSGDTLIYLDPPYLMQTRSCQRPIYRHEFSAKQHATLLRVINRLPCIVMISGYWSEMYAESLQGWRSVSFQAQTRGGKLATEWVWMNFNQPLELHDYRYLGENFRERERIKRKRRRWRDRLLRMDSLERHAVLMAIDELRNQAVTS